MIALIAASMMGRAPQDAQVDGRWWVWLAANTSATVDEGELEELLTESATVFECSGRGWDNAEDRWDYTYIGPKEDDDPTNDDRWIGGDCAPDDSDCDQAEMDEDCAAIDALGSNSFPSFGTEDEVFTGYTFLQTDGFYALTDEVVPWRTEALLNSEGDFQLTTHHWLGNDQDMRFAFSIDPDFAPVVCTSDDDGNPTIEYIDGSPWLEQWSADEGDYTIYYLNDGGYQPKPGSDISSSGFYWYLDTDVIAGTARAKFAAEEFLHETVFYSRSVDSTDLVQSGAYTTEEHEQTYAELNDAAQVFAADIYETARATYPDGSPGFQHKTESNLWRPVDDQWAGYAGWLEMHRSWVRVKKGSSFAPGGTVEGDYQILFEGYESGSKFLVSGTFKVDDLKEDKWGYEFIEDVKREENETPFCGGAAYPD